MGFQKGNKHGRAWAGRKPTLRSLKDKCWRVFSEYIRRKDADEGGTVYCYTCSRPFFWRDVHAGHAIPGRGNAVLFDEDIVKPQCPKDNIFGGGMYHVFATKLIKEHGMEWWDKKLEGSRQVVKWTRLDLEEKYNFYQDKIRNLPT